MPGCRRSTDPASGSALVEWGFGSQSYSDEDVVMLVAAGRGMSVHRTIVQAASDMISYQRTKGLAKTCIFKRSVGTWSTARAGRLS